MIVFTSATKYWRLIFEDSTIGFEQEEANLIVDIHIEDNVKASAQLTDVSTGNVYEETFSKDLSAFTDEKERMKQVKHVVSYVYLSVLQQLTGIEQSWGILTEYVRRNFFTKCFKMVCQKKKRIKNFVKVI